MGCGRKAAALEEEAESAWRKGLSSDLNKLNDASEALEVLSEKLALTREQFVNLDKAVLLLNGITGKKRFW